MVWRYFAYRCSNEDCEEMFEDMYNIPMESSIEEMADEIGKATCPACGKEGKRIPFCGILKGEIEEITHGGRISGGKLYRKYTGFKEIREERKIAKQMRHAKKNGDVDTAVAAAKELASKTKENTGKAKK